MSASEQAALYRLHAAKCIELAQTSTDSQSKLSLLEIARSWRMLADQVDKNSEIGTTLVYETQEGIKLPRGLMIDAAVIGH